jgi:hypothetical protein
MEMFQCHYECHVNIHACSNYLMAQNVTNHINLLDFPEQRSNTMFCSKKTNKLEKNQFFYKYVQNSCTLKYI